MKGLEQEEIQEILGLSRVLREGNYYELIGVSRDADPGTIKRSYYNLSRRYHPDRFFRRDTGEYRELIEELFTGINTAYEVLADAAARRRYDASIRPTAPKGRGGRGRGRARKVVVRPPPAEEGGHEVDFRLPPRAGSSSAPPSAPRGEKPEDPAPAGAARPSRRPPGRVRTQADALRRKLVAQLARARRYYRAGLEDMEQERWIKAAASLYLATRFDTANQAYKEAYLKAKVHADRLRAAQFISAAESAESYRNLREAVANYRKAAECDPPEGLAFYRLAVLLQGFEEDPRGALQQYRRAVEKEPSNVGYRLALANMYAELSLWHNARREYRKVLELDAGNAEAKEGLKRAGRAR